MKASEKEITKHARSALVALAAILALAAIAGCGKGRKGGAVEGETATPPVADTAKAAEVTAMPPPPPGSARRDPLVGGPYPSMLVVQSQFREEGGSPKPGPARLDIVRKTAAGWTEVVVEDPDSNVFHKAVPFTAPDGRKGILTAAAMKAILKFWWFEGGEWRSETLWSTAFGGKFDRLRDLEIGDVDGDGKDEIVIATHDQGVIAVVSRSGDAWKVTEVDRSPDTFVHEIEIGDVDGDGRKEFFATPSKPNVVGKSQGGEVVMFRWDGKGWARSTVGSWDTRHVKEILAADLDGDGRATLFAVLEAELENVAGVSRIKQPVEIREFEFEGPAPTSKVAATIDDAQCRFLSWGDVDGDGKNEMVAAAMKTGLWLLRPSSPGSWTAENFEKDSSGFEHATIVADVDGDGVREVWVAADDQLRLSRYVWKGGKPVREDMMPLPKGVITWNLVPASL